MAFPILFAFELILEIVGKYLRNMESAFLVADMLFLVPQ